MGKLWFGQRVPGRERQTNTGPTLPNGMPLLCGPQVDFRDSSGTSALSISAVLGNMALTR